MKYLLSFFLLIAFAKKSMSQDLGNDQIYLADPTIFQHQGTYYLYGTKGDYRIKGQGFLVYSSKNLKDWEGPVGVSNGFALKKGDAFGTKGFWAPQIFERDGKFVMAYTADEHIAIATSDSPLGPFVNKGKALEAPVRQIDPFIFYDDDGKVYLYHVRLQDGNRIFVAEMQPDLSAIKPETLTPCIEAEKGTWEDTANADWRVSEGPTVIKNGDEYLLFYSTNDFRNPDYAVGFATSLSPLGPWKKSDQNPIISTKTINYKGTGHGDIFFDTKGEMNYVLHTHFSDDKVSPRKTGIIRLDFDPKTNRFRVRPKSFYFVKTKTSNK